MAVQVNHPTPPPDAITVSADMPGNEELCLADGVLSPLNPVQDDYPDVYLYNDTNIGGAAPDADLMTADPTRTATVDPPSSGSTDRYWHVTRFSGGQRPSTVDPGNPNNPNNTLYVLAHWWRDQGNGLFDEIWDPITPGGDPTVKADARPKAVDYRGVEGNCDQKLFIACAKSSAKSKRAGLALSSRKGRWMKYRDIPAATGGGAGYLLLDHRNEELRASRIAIYAFDVDWTYTYKLGIPENQRVARHVRRPLGDIVSNEDSTPGAGFFPKSPKNSLVLWQSDLHHNPRVRTVIVSQSKSKPDIIDLDDSRGIYLHLNYQRGVPLDVAGTFSVAVKVLR